MNKIVPDHSADIRWQYRLKLPDAIHLSAASAAGCSHFLTRDSDFKDEYDRKRVAIFQICCRVSNLCFHACRYRKAAAQSCATRISQTALHIDETSAVHFCSAPERANADRPYAKLCR